MVSKTECDKNMSEPKMVSKCKNCGDRQFSLAHDGFNTVEIRCVHCGMQQASIHKGGGNGTIWHTYDLNAEGNLRW